jgi:hypothetical protein
VRRIALSIVLAALACQGCGTTSRESERLVDTRERERMGLDEKRKSAIWDLSRDSRFNPRR